MAAIQLSKQTPMVFKQLLDRVESGAPLSSGARWHSRFIRLLPRVEGSRHPHHEGRAPPTLRGEAQGRDWEEDAARGMGPSSAWRSVSLRQSGAVFLPPRHRRAHVFIMALTAAGGGAMVEYLSVSNVSVIVIIV